MKRRRRIETTIETYEVLAIRTSRESAQVWCSECAGHVPLVKPEEAAVLVSVNARTIYRWVEADRVHFREMPEGFLLICVNSLFNREKENTRCY
jgi:hypothetical protein